jgi:hypothetical protein
MVITPQNEERIDFSTLKQEPDQLKIGKDY